jgi:TusE/DsrC/DsvC family sulfur relay protein
MSTLTLDVKFNEEGFLVDAKEWTEELARYLAEQEGILQLTDRHWDVIRFMRKEYLENGEVPTIRRLKNAGGIPTKELYELFPNGPAKKAARIAGLPKPKGCV